MTVSKAQQKANVKYRKKAYDRIELTVEKGKREQIKSFAARQGETLNGFINRLIDEAIKKDAP